MGHKKRWFDSKASLSDSLTLLWEKFHSIKEGESIESRLAAYQQEAELRYHCRHRAFSQLPDPLAWKILFQLESFDLLSRYQPKNDQERINVSYALYRMNRYASAEQCLLPVQESSLSQVKSILLAHIYYRMRRYSASYELYQQISDLPSSITLEEWQTNLLACQSQLTSELKSTMNPISPTFDTLYNQGCIALIQKKYAFANQLFQQSLELGLSTLSTNLDLAGLQEIAPVIVALQLTQDASANHDSWWSCLKPVTKASLSSQLPIQSKDAWLWRAYQKSRSKETVSTAVTMFQECGCLPLADALQGKGGSSFLNPVLVTMKPKKQAFTTQKSRQKSSLSTPKEATLPTVQGIVLD